jgi:hypothetical protein
MSFGKSKGTSLISARSSSSLAGTVRRREPRAADRRKSCSAGIETTLRVLARSAGPTHCRTAPAAQTERPKGSSSFEFRFTQPSVNASGSPRCFQPATCAPKSMIGC